MNTNFFAQMTLPPQSILFIHARLKNLQIQYPAYSYATLTDALLTELQTRFTPRAMLVPTYTPYAFMLTGVYHRLFSRSEVGRFSEEVRLRFPAYRTPDPMFSVVDVMNYLPSQKIDYSSTFGENSLFAYLTQQDYTIINIDMEGFYATQVHTCEIQQGITYRHTKTYEGIVYQNERDYHQIQYTAFVRDFALAKASSPTYNQIQRKLFLQQSGLLQQAQINNIEIAWMSAQNFTATIMQALKQDKNFLIYPP